MAKKPMADASFQVGDKVLVGTTQELGTVKFIGTTSFSPGEWVGVELDKQLGKNDGTVKGERYFDCKPDHGLFIRRSALQPVNQAETADNAKSPKPKSSRASSRGSSGTRKSMTKSVTKPLPGNTAGLAEKFTGAKTGEPRPSPSSPSAEAPATAKGASADQGPEVAAALTELRMAAEDRKVDGLRQAIQNAMKRGVAPEEIAAAQHILSFESQKSLCQEIDKVRRVVAGLTQSVSKTQARAADNDKWVDGLIQRIEQRVWQTLEEKVEERIQIAVQNVAQEMLARSPVVPNGLTDQQQQQQVAAVPSRSPAVSSGATEQEEQAATRIQAVQRGKSEREELCKKTEAAKKIQASWRRKLARQTGDPASDGFAAAAFTARSRHKDWGSIFDKYSLPGGLDAVGFHKALVEIHPRLTSGQTSILFKGYTSGTGSPVIDLPGFCGTAEAVAVGDREASEFADVNVETFQSLAVAGGSEAALKIQAVHRGKAAREEVAVMKSQAAASASEASSIDDLRSRAKQQLEEANANGKLRDAIVTEVKIDAGAKALDETAEGNEQKPNEAESKAAVMKPQAAASASEALDETAEGNEQKPNEAESKAALKIQAVQRGNAAREEVAVMKSQAAASASEALDETAEGNEQKPSEAESKAAIKIQRWYRRLAKKNIGNPFGAAVRKVQLRHQDWCDVFDEFMAVTEMSLIEEPFVQAVQRVLPSRASAAQLRALYKGYLEGTDGSAVDLVGFVGLCEAVATGPSEAAEYADISVEMYLMLGNPEADAAASKIGAVVKGRQHRAAMGG